MLVSAEAKKVARDRDTLEVGIKRQWPYVLARTKSVSSKKNGIFLANLIFFLT